MTSGWDGSDEVSMVLAAARRLTGMPAGYLAEFDAGQQVLRSVDDPQSAFGLTVGDASHLEATFCQRMVDGRLERVVPDAVANEVTAALPGTLQTGIRSYMGVPVRYPDGRLYGSLCCIDREPRRDLQERDADLLEALGSLLGCYLAGQQRLEQVTRQGEARLASISHDLRTPLLAMRFLGEDLQGTAPLDRRAAGVTIEREANRVLAMVGDLMADAERRDGTAVLRVEEIDVGELVHEGADRARRAHRADDHSAIIVQVPEHPVRALIDVHRVLRALGNLLDNALKYSRATTPVTIEVRDEGATVVLAVIDRGSGVAHDEIGHLHERFYRSPAASRAGVAGLGLGLATVQAVADLHEGTLRVESELGVGSRFELRLPVRPPARSR